MCTSCGDNNCNQCNVGYHVDYSLHSDNTSGGNSTSSVDWANILNKPVLFPPISQIHTFITDWDTAILALIPFSSISNTNSISLNLATSILSASLNLSMGSVGANFRVTNSIQPDGLLSTIPVAGTATSGALTYIDWNIFNNKQDALGFTPPPNTRTITLTSPTWSKTYDLSANRTWNNIGDILSSGSYSNPSWITALAWAKITGTPTTLAGYGITDGGIAVGHGLSLTTGPTVAIDETSLTSNYMPYWAGTKFANTGLLWNYSTNVLTMGALSVNQILNTTGTLSSTIQNGNSAYLTNFNILNDLNNGLSIYSIGSTFSSSGMLIAGTTLFSFSANTNIQSGHNTVLKFHNTDSGGTNIPTLELGEEYVENKVAIVNSGIIVSTSTGAYTVPNNVSFVNVTSSYSTGLNAVYLPSTPKQGQYIKFRLAASGGSGQVYRICSISTNINDGVSGYLIPYLSITTSATYPYRQIVDMIYIGATWIVLNY